MMNENHYISFHCIFRRLYLDSLVMLKRVFALLRWCIATALNKDNIIKIKIHIRSRFPSLLYLLKGFISYQLILPFLHRSMYTMGQVAPINGVATTSVSRPPSASPVTPPTQPGKDYDFSSLTHGMFSKP